jgi:predicted PurR-regulated permease PerM
MAAPPPELGLGSVFSNRWVKLALAALGLAFLGWLVYTLRGILVPFGLAIVAAYVLDPLVVWLEGKVRLGRTVVVVALVLVLAVVLLSAIGLGVYYAVTTVEKAVPAAQRALAGTPETQRLWERVQDAVASIPNELRAELRKAIEDLPTTIRSHFGTISGSVLLGLGAVAHLLLNVALSSLSFVMFFVVTVYLLLALPTIRQVAKDLLPRRYRGDILWVGEAIDRDVKAFFRGQVVVCLIDGVIFGVGLWICGVDFGLLIGLLAGLAGMVPYMGLALGLPTALLLALVPYAGMWKPLGVVVTFAVGMTADNLFLTPKILGRNVGLSPVAIILAILVFGQLLGILGVIFAVPLAAVTKVLLGELVRYYKRIQEPETRDVKRET